MSPVIALGYVASLLIVLSVSRTSILQLRILGLAGSLTFFAYSLAIEAYPVAITNIVLAGLHCFFLFQLLSRKREFFTSLELTRESKYLRHFLDFYGDDIQLHQPGFTFTAHDEQIRAFVLRDMMPTGLFIGRSCDDGSVEIELDYVIPQFRDLKVARFLYSKRSGIFNELGHRKIWTLAGNDDHVRYFKRLGFAETSTNGQPTLSTEIGELVR